MVASMTFMPMSEQFGRCCSDPLENSQEYLTIHFSPGASARQERWRNYGLSADFLGDYFATFFPGENASEERLNQRDTIKFAVSFIANELLENAIKYTDESVQEPISISLYLYQSSIVFKSVNYINKAVEAKFKTFIQTILAAEDIETVFSQQLERTATGSGDSSMGLLTMMCDYGAEFGWVFVPLDEEATIVQVNVLAYLDI